MERPGSAEIRVAGSTPALAQALAGGLGPLGLGRRRLAVDVGDAEPAADDQLGQTERGEERAEHLGGLLERGRLEDLAADVRVDADELDARHELERGDRLAPRRPRRRRSRTWSPPGRCGRTRGCAPRRRASPGRGPSGRSAAGGRRLEQAAEAGDLVEGVDDDPADARSQAVGQLVGRLVVAVEDEPVRRARRRTGRRGARRRTRRRGASPPRGPDGPWPGTGRPWWRRPRRHPRPRPPRGRRDAGGPRRRRTAACRTPRPARAGRRRRRGGGPSRRPSAVRGRSWRSSGAVATSWSVGMEMQDTAAFGRSVRPGIGRGGRRHVTSTIVPCSCSVPPP